MVGTNGVRLERDRRRTNEHANVRICFVFLSLLSVIATDHELCHKNNLDNMVMMYAISIVTTQSLNRYQIEESASKNLKNVLIKTGKQQQQHRQLQFYVFQRKTQL
ncbi:CLUMA_CG019213, isoform A [Clunio marinus]|uniref:CLUMA_CG019213, isoform A n=1 Tax=Clunio marinus TaxID=568069 RepID=A0A1J1J4C8_9DIPT|nr:CLUMA_CG019213, isoform A [Clunio marinus]